MEKSAKRARHGRLYRRLGGRSGRFPGAITISASSSPTRASPRASRTRTSWSTPPRGYFILTLYEKRVAPEDLPFFLALMEHLAARGLTCPQPVKNRDRRLLGWIAGRPAAIVTFLDGMWIRRPSAGHCAALGEALAQLHLAGADFPMRRRNALSVDGWRPLYVASAAGADSVQPGSARGDRAGADAARRRMAERICRKASSMRTCFPTMCSSSASKLSGLIDFYFACTDTLAYDIAICLNAWCFEPDHSYNVTKGRALLQGYVAARPLSIEERVALPLLCARRVSALPADAAGRLAQRAARRAGAPEGPARIFPQAALPSGGRPACATTASTHERGCAVRTTRHRLYRRRLRADKSGPRRLGRDPASRASTEGVEGRRAASRPTIAWS